MVKIDLDSVRRMVISLTISNGMGKFSNSIFISYKVSIVAFRKEDKYEVKTVKAKDIKESGARSRPTSPVGFSEYIPKEKYDDSSCKFLVFKKNPCLLKKCSLLALIFPRNDFILQCDQNNKEAVRGIEVKLNFSFS